MIGKYFISLVFIFSASFVWSGTGVLDRIITVEINNTPIKTILVVIEKRASVQFSYNPDLIEEDKIVSLTIQKKTIAYGLSLIFNKSVRFKEVGNHIVLLKNEDVAELKKRKKSSLSTEFRGVISNKETGEPISGVSIYDIDARYAAVSDSRGNYKLQIPNAETVRSLYIRKKGFKEFVFVVDATNDSVFVRNIKLQPYASDIAKINTRKAERIYLPVEERVLSGALVSYDTYVHAENLEGIEESRLAQISLVPSLGIGSNLSINGLVTNNFSLNILAGYSNGVDGAEFGGIVNMVKGDARWFQAGGISNLVGGGFTGAQMGGIFNSVRKNFTGFQSSGICGAVGGDFTGLQTAGIFGLNHKDVLGAQVAGISAITKGRLEGLQISGIFSAARCGFRGLQLSGISNLADSTSYGLQVSGIHNTVYGNLNGGQIAGITNFSRGGINFFQAGGIGNVADKNYGLQFASIFNFAKQNNGLQVGLINVSVDAKGASFGLVNFVAKGYHKTEVSANEIFPVNLVLKSGIRRFYNTYNFGMQFGDNPAYGFGLGFGTNHSLNEKWSVSCDLSGQMVVENQFESFEFAQLYKLSTTIDLQLAKWVTLFFGPSINANVIQFKDAEGVYTSGVGLAPIYNTEFEGGRVKISLGGQLGLRF